jgi:hypothetical protein
MALMETFVTLLVAVFAFAVRIGVMHGTANLLLYQDQSWKKAGKIVFVEVLYDIALTLSIWMFMFGLGSISPLLGAFSAGLMALLGGLYLLYYMVKYTGKTYETNFFEGGVIYFLAAIIAAVIIGGFQLLAV